LKPGDELYEKISWRRVGFDEAGPCSWSVKKSSSSSSSSFPPWLSMFCSFRTYEFSCSDFW
jgi:hypothetical protein